MSTVNSEPKSKPTIKSSAPPKPSGQKKKEENKIDNNVEEKKQPSERRFKHEIENEALGVQWSLSRLPEEYVNSSALFNILSQDLREHYYLTKTWEPSFYAKLCYRGFVCVSYKRHDGCWLLPELQRHYSVITLQESLSLDEKCGTLHVSKNTRKRSKKYNLKISQDFKAVWKGLEDLHKGSNWVIKEYQTLFMKLAEQDEKEDGVTIGLDKTKALFCPVSVELFDIQGNLAAGEFGYTIGSTYTSLSGFSVRERQFNGAGIVQLCVLARVLEKKGYRLWNMGHPYKAGKTADKASMMYKKEIGANVVSRADFLSIWSKHRDTENTTRLWGSFSCKPLLEKRS